mgnify:CR=1 FL=1
MSESGSGEPVDSNTDSDKEFSCADCGKTYATPGGLLYHVRNTECGSITCPECGICCPTEQGLKTHYGSNHTGSLVIEVTECDYCDSTFQYNPNETAGKYCCDKCCKSHRKEKRLTKTCPTCEDEFEIIPAIEHRKFCSESCYAEYSSEIQKGSKSHNWKGGTLRYYGENWNKQRDKARKRDNHTCQRCGVAESELDQQLDVHHIKRLGWFKEEYDAPVWWEKANALDNLLSLCRSCHYTWEGIPLRPDSR